HRLAARLDPRVTVRAPDHLERHARSLLRALFEAAPDEALGGVHGILRIRHGLALGNLTDQHLTFVIPSNDGRRGARALFVDDDFGFFAFHDRNDAIRGSEVDSNNLAHDVLLNSCRYSGFGPGRAP